MGFLDAARSLLAPPPVEQKAMVGAGAYVLEHHVPLFASQTKVGPRFFKQAQVISHSNPWVATAERVVSGRFASIGWHLEDANGDEYPENATGVVGDIRRLLERPSPRMTRRQLWQITSRHLGVCGNAFWYLDQRDLVAGTPQAIYYVNPARMTPVVDKAGNLVRWALDADDWDSNTGFPLELDEVLHFVLEPPDWGHYGHGLVESALTKVDVQRNADRFMRDVFQAGGKKGGVVSPKEGLLPDEVFQAAVQSFRTVAESDDAARRTIILKGAVDYQATSSTPSEMRLAEILALTRDDILGIWGVPLSQIGIKNAQGLNSGETIKYEEAALWQGAIHERVVAFWEVIQYQLLDRFAQLGGESVQLVLEEPAFDDQEPLYKLADLAKSQPLRNIERREILGLEPFGDERDEEVWLPNTLTRVWPEPEEPEPEPLVRVEPGRQALLEAGDEVEEEAEQKARTSPLASLRAAIERDEEPRLKAAVEKALQAQRTDVLRRLREQVGHLLRKPKDVATVWRRDFEGHLSRALTLDPIAVKVTDGAAKTLSRPQKAETDWTQAALEFVRTRGGERITGINATTRDAVLEAVGQVLEEAVQEGLSPDDVADLLQDRVGGLAVWGDARAELIARTETMLAYNDAALRSYSEFGVSQVQALDGDKDADCAARDGRIYPVSEAYGIADHPNGTLDWAPVS